MHDSSKSNSKPNSKLNLTLIITTQKGNGKMSPSRQQYFLMPPQVPNVRQCFVLWALYRHKSVAPCHRHIHYTFMPDPNPYTNSDLILITSFILHSKKILNLRIISQSVGTCKMSPQIWGDSSFISSIILFFNMCLLVYLVGKITRISFFLKNTFSKIKATYRPPECNVHPGGWWNHSQIIRVSEMS